VHRPAGGEGLHVGASRAEEGCQRPYRCWSLDFNLNHQNPCKVRVRVPTVPGGIGGKGKENMSMKHSATT